MDNFQHQQRTAKHYERILSAKPSLPEKQRRRSLCLRSDPIKTFQLNMNNEKLAQKLVEIYQNKTKKKRKRKLKKKKSAQKSKSLMNEYRKKQHELMIDNSNMKMMQRITAVKATIGDWDKREKKLHSYRKLSQKSYEGKKQQSLYKQFRKTLVTPSKKSSFRKKGCPSLNF